MFRKLALLVLLLVPFLGSSQDSTKYSIGVDFNYHPQDFLFHVRGQLLKKKLSHELFVGFGIKNTLFQGQLSPRFGYDLSYRFSLTSWLFISPLVRFSYALLNTKVPEKHPWIHTTEGFAGGRLSIGRKHKFALAGGIGPSIEWKYNAYSASRDHFFMWNYFAEITYYYAF